MALEKTIKIKVDQAGASSDINKLNSRMGRLDGSTKKTSKSFGALKASVIAVAAALQVRQIAQYADAFTSIQNQIRQTTNSTKDLTDKTNALLAVANRSRVEFAATAELYTNLALSTENLNLSTEQQLRLTETISKSFAVSGKSAAESAGAIRQLGQAFASGALRGDEFNSIAEGAPEIMRALQRSLNLTQGELREFAATGGITSEVLVTALSSAAEVIDEKMSKATRTLAQSFQEAKNNATAFVGSSEFIENAMTGAGDAVVFLSENLGVLVANGSKFDGIAKDLTLSLGALSDQFEFTGDSSNFLLDAFADMPENIRTFIKVSTIEILSFFDRSALEAKAFHDKIKAIFTDDTLDAVSERRVVELERLNQIREESIQSIFDEREASIQSSNAQIAKAKELRDAKKEPAKAVSFSISPTIKRQKSKKTGGKSSDELLDSEQSKTESLKIELEERRKIQIAYNNLALQDFQTYAEQEFAIIEFNRLQESYALDAKIAESAAYFEKKNQEALLQGEKSAEIRLELHEQRKVQEQIFEEERLEIQQNAAQESEEIARREAEVKRQIQQGAFGAFISGLSVFGKKSIKLQRNLAIVNAGIKGKEAAVKAWDAGMSTGGPYAPAVAAAYTLASLAKTGSLISSIKSAGSGNSSGGGGVSASIPSPSAQRQEPIQQNNVVEFRGLAEVAEALNNTDSDQVLPVEYTQRIVNSLEEYNRLSGGG